MHKGSTLLEQLPLLLIFDNVESLLDEESRSKIADPDLAVFLRTLVNATTHGTKFLFTSRYTFRLLEDERHGGSAPITAHRLQQAFAAINLGDLARPEAIQIMHKFPSLSNAGYGLKQDIYSRIGGHPYTLNVFAHHCQSKRPEDVLRSLGEVTGETARFAMLEMSWDKLSVRARELLTRISVFQKTIPLAAMEWVMGDSDQLAVDSNQLAMFRELIRKSEEMAEQVKELSDEQLDEMLEQMLPQQRRSEPVTQEIEELIHWGLIVQLAQIPSLRQAQDTTWEGSGGYSPLEGVQGGVFPDRPLSAWEGLGVGYTVHTLVRDFCQGKMEASDRRHALLDAAEFYQNVAKALPPESQAQVFTKLDARHLLFEAEEFERAGSLVHKVQDLLTRWGFMSLVERLLRESVATREEHGKAVALGSLGDIYYDRGEYDMAVKLYQQVYEFFEKIDDKRNMATARHQIGMIHQDRGDYAAAQHEYQASLQIKEELGDKAGIAITRNSLGIIHYLRGDYEAALREYQASLQIKEEIGDKAGITYTQGNIGNIHYQQGDYEAALKEYEAVLRVSEELGDKSNIAKARHRLGMIHHNRGDYASALREYQASLQIAEELGDKAGIASTKGQIAQLHEEREEYPAAFEGYLQALVIFTQLQSPDVRIAISCLRRLRTKWGAAAFDAAWQAATGDAVPEEMK